MKRKWRKAFKIIGFVLLVLTVLTAAVTTYTIRNSWPQETGNIKLPGLKERVEASELVMQ